MKKQQRTYDAERFDVLAGVYARTGTEVDQSAVGGYRTKAISAGDMLYISCYPLISSRETWEAQKERLAELRASKEKKTLAKFARYNNHKRIRDFEILCNKNFEKNDLHVCMTYAQLEAWYDRGEKIGEFFTEDDAKRHVRNYLNRIKTLLRKHGCDLQEFRWALVTVVKEPQYEASADQPVRMHHHMLMHGVPEELRNQVEMLWPYGTANADRLQPDGKGIAAMAQYIARQEGAANGSAYKRHSYSCSRNILRPEVRTSDAKISRRRVSQIAADVRQNAAEIFGKIYPEYRLTEWPEIKISDFTAGAYIYARLIRKEGHANGNGKMGKTALRGRAGDDHAAEDGRKRHPRGA